MTDGSPGDRGFRVLAVGGLIYALLLAAFCGAATGVGKPVPLSGLMYLLLLLFKPAVGIPVAVASGVLVYFGWLRPAWSGRVQFTTRTWLGLLCLLALSVYWYLGGWVFGMRWQGRTYTVGCAIIGAFLFMTVVAAGMIGRWASAPAVALFGRWVALVWVVTYAYPWLGEGL